MVGPFDAAAHLLSWSVPPTWMRPFTLAGVAKSKSEIASFRRWPGLWLWSTFFRHRASGSSHAPSDGPLFPDQAIPAPPSVWDRLVLYRGVFHRMMAATIKFSPLALFCRSSRSRSRTAPVKERPREPKSFAPRLCSNRDGPAAGVLDSESTPGWRASARPGQVRVTTMPTHFPRISDAETVPKPIKQINREKVRHQ